MHHKVAFPIIFKCFTFTVLTKLSKEKLICFHLSTHTAA